MVQIYKKKFVNVIEREYWKDLPYCFFICIWGHCYFESRILKIVEFYIIISFSNWNLNLGGSLNGWWRGFKLSWDFLWIFIKLRDLTSTSLKKKNLSHYISFKACHKKYQNYCVFSMILEMKLTAKLVKLYICLLKQLFFFWGKIRILVLHYFLLII